MGAVAVLPRRGKQCNKVDHDAGVRARSNDSPICDINSAHINMGKQQGEKELQRAMGQAGGGHHTARRLVASFTVPEVGGIGIIWQAWPSFRSLPIELYLILIM